MEWLISFAESPCCSNLLFALLHSLWQGAIIAALLYLFFRTKFPKSENARYKAGVVAMAAVVLCFLFTFSILNFQSDETTKTNIFNGEKQQKDIAAVESLQSIVQAEAIELQSVSEKHLAASASTTGKMDFNWKPLVLTLWFVGVVIMLLRAMYLIAGGAKLRSECNVLKDERILAIAESLRERMKITRKIRIVVSEQISIPGVIGFFRSVLFLPASMLSGMPADALEAILAHELAHIKRYDYLVNFCQMVVEAILFFNPAVWWISRQIRIEREVCCDNAGIATIGRRIRYAEVLVGWAEKLRQPDMELSTAAMGFGVPDTHGPMAERIKRIVATDHKPALKAPWHIAGMTLLFSFIAIGCLWMGADVTVAVAGKVLSTQERMDRISEISEEYGYSDEEYGEEDMIQISGTVKTWDGKPLPENTSIYLKIKRNNGNMGRGIDMSTDDPLAAIGTFNQKIEYGTVDLIITADGYAPIKVGPLHTEPGGKIEGLDYILQKGYSATVKVVDGNNEPIENVKITVAYSRSGRASSSIFPTTDANGIATIENAADIGIFLTLDADGFEPYNTGTSDFDPFESKDSEFILNPDEINVIQLTASKEINGIVVSKETGEPVAGAILKEIGTSSIGNSLFPPRLGNNRRLETVSDENGRFRLRNINSNVGYLIGIEAEGYMWQYVSDVIPGTENITIELMPERPIKGTVIGDLTKLEKDENDTPIVTYTLFTQSAHGGSINEEEKATVKIENGIGYFEVEKCPGPTVLISAGDRKITLNADEDDLGNVLINLNPEDARVVVFKFDVSEDEPDIKGKVRIRYNNSSKPNMIMLDHLTQLDRNPMEIVDNQVRIEIPGAGEFNFSIDVDDGNRPAGYWFNRHVAVDIPDGDAPYIVEIPVYPTGAVYGTIRRHDGTIIENAQVIVVNVGESEASEQLDAGSISGFALYEERFNVTNGTFNLATIPFDGEYGIFAVEDNSYGVSELIEINEKNPIVNIDIDVPEGVDVQGRLVDADGNPVMAQVQIATDIEKGKISHRLFSSGIWPDEEGRFVFENVNPGPYGKCRINVHASKGYQKAVYEIEDLREPILIQLKESLRVAGVVINEETGLPVSGVNVLAVGGAKQNDYGIWENIEAEEATNEKGEFVITGMSEGSYGLILNINYPSSIGYVYDRYEITVGQDEPCYFPIKLAPEERF
jgi:beta-lactamase regulating signal transducer with metallopeptidase domain